MQRGEHEQIQDVTEMQRSFSFGWESKKTDLGASWRKRNLNQLNRHIPREWQLEKHHIKGLEEMGRNQRDGGTEGSKQDPIRPSTSG